MLPSQLYAATESYHCEGVFTCHWCGAPCTNRYLHDDPPPPAFLRPSSPRLAAHPGSAYICHGCRLWRRQRTVLLTLGGHYLDRTDAQHHSWLLTNSGCFVLASGDSSGLYTLLLRPPPHFALSLTHSASGSIRPNHLQHMIVNDTVSGCVDTPLAFTLNGIKHTYTVYELEEAIRASGLPTGAEPGVHALLRTLGIPPPLPPRELPKQGRNADKPGDGKITKKPLH